MTRCPIHDREMDTERRYGVVIETCDVCRAEQVSRLHFQERRR